MTVTGTTYENKGEGCHYPELDVHAFRSSPTAGAVLC